MREVCACVCVYMCSILDQFVPVSVSECGCVCVCVCVCGRRYSMSAAGSTQAAAAAERERERERERQTEGERERARENEREGTPAKEREAKRGTSTGSLCTGPELLQSESPYRKKAGSSQQRSGPRTHTHTHAHTHTHTPEQNNTRASVSAQQSSSGSGSCLDLQLCAKNNKDQDNVGTDMQHSPVSLLCLQILPSSLGQILPLCDIVDERGLGIPMLWSVPRLPPGDAKTVRWKISFFFFLKKLAAGIFAMLLLEVIQVHILSSSSPLFRTARCLSLFFSSSPIFFFLSRRKVMKGNRVTWLRSAKAVIFTVKC